MIGPERWVVVTLGALAGAGGGFCLGEGYYVLALAFAVILVNLLVLPPLIARSVRRVSFRYGWLAGRHAMLSSMIEAQKRHLTMIQFIEAEMERDGIPVTSIEVEIEDD
jgi:hypothetical protein